MKHQEIKLKHEFSELLQNLGPDFSDITLLSGNKSGWDNRLAWNPCDKFVANSITEDFYSFIKKHQAKKHLIVGVLSYELGYELHNLTSKKSISSELPNIVLLAYDNYLETIDNKTCAYFTQSEFLKHLEELDQAEYPSSSEEAGLKFKTVWDKKLYFQAFAKIKNYIYEGFIYQINLTQPVTAESENSPRDIFKKLADKNSAKMMAYIENQDFQLISMSPERFIRTKGRAIETTPIKGTAQRGVNSNDDLINKQNLLANEKEKAELNMITDLLRNDLGKVCQPGSVKVVKDREIEKLSKIFHTFSSIKGILHQNVSPIQALISMFPGGSITGCPKRKAMEIIDELEDLPRSFYCGNLFVIDQKGDLDSSILIRTIIKKGRDLTMGVGSGIVYDSLEENEYQENLNKAESVI